MWQVVKVFVWFVLDCGMQCVYCFFFCFVDGILGDGGYFLLCLLSDF